jgi:hypothetical protein
VQTVRTHAEEAATGADGREALSGVVAEKNVDSLDGGQLQRVS